MPVSQAIGRQIPLPQGKRWAVGDIHGCHKTFLKLLEKIQLQAEDQLFLLGDFINKGPASLNVLKEIIQLKGQVFPILGNHDKLYVDYYLSRNNESAEILRSLNSAELVDANTSLQEKIFQFYQSLPHYYISGDIILVHAGFNFEIDDVFSDPDAMLTIKEFSYNPSKVGGRFIVHGHFPTPLHKIREAIGHKRKVIPLDNGCVYRGNLSGTGNLIGLELNEMRLISQVNIDQT